MNVFFKNILCLFLAIFLGYFATLYMGMMGIEISSQEILYASFLPVILLGSVNGSLAFIFFLVLIFTLQGFLKNKYWITIPLIPYLIMWVSSNIIEIYLPTIVFLIALVLGIYTRKLFQRIRNKSINFQ